MEFFKARLYELSTWRGLVLILTAGGIKMFPLFQQNILIGGLVVSGALGLFFKDSLAPVIPTIPANLGAELNAATALIGAATAKEIPKEEIK